MFTRYHRDRSAGRPRCWHSLEVFRNISSSTHAVLSLTRTTRARHLFPDCQIVPQSPFGPSARSSAAYFCFCQSEVFHQSVCVSPLVICSLFLICTAPSTAAWLWKTSAEARWRAFLSCCCPKWGFSRLESWVEMLVNVIGSSTQSEVKSRGNDERESSRLTHPRCVGTLCKRYFLCLVPHKARWLLFLQCWWLPARRQALLWSIFWDYSCWPTHTLENLHDFGIKK